MIGIASQEIKELFEEMEIIDLDVGKEINTHGNYLVFDRFKPDEMLSSGTFTFTLYMALKSLQRGNQESYGELDEIIEAVSSAAQNNIACECKGIELQQFGERLFIYAVTLEITRSW